MGNTENAAIQAFDAVLRRNKFVKLIFL